jgi:hypothetical protein
MTASVAVQGGRPDAACDIARRLRVEIQFAHKSGDRKADVALDRYSRMRAQSAVPGRAGQAIALPRSKPIQEFGRLAVYTVARAMPAIYRHLTLPFNVTTATLAAYPHHDAARLLPIATVGWHKRGHQGVAEVGTVWSNPVSMPRRPFGLIPHHGTDHWPRPLPQSRSIAQSDVVTVLMLPGSARPNRRARAVS